MEPDRAEEVEVVNTSLTRAAMGLTTRNRGSRVRHQKKVRPPRRQRKPVRQAHAKGKKSACIPRTSNAATAQCPPPTRPFQDTHTPPPHLDKFHSLHSVRIPAQKQRSGTKPCPPPSPTYAARNAAVSASTTGSSTTGAAEGWARRTAASSLRRPPRPKEKARPVLPACRRRGACRKAHTAARRGVAAPVMMTQKGEGGGRVDSGRGKTASVKRQGYG